MPAAFDDVLRGVALKAYPGLRSTVRSLRERGARLMIGVPDYETYVAHRKANHPGQPIMSYVEFFRERQQARMRSARVAFEAAADGTVIRPADVRFGSKADIAARLSDVRFTPKSGH